MIIKCQEKQETLTSCSTSIPVCKMANIQVCKYARRQVYKYASMQGDKYTSMQVCKYISTQVCKYASIQVCRVTHVPLLKTTCLSNVSNDLNYLSFVNLLNCYFRSYQSCHVFKLSEFVKLKKPKLFCSCVVGLPSVGQVTAFEGAAVGKARRQDFNPSFSRALQSSAELKRAWQSLAGLGKYQMPNTKYQIPNTKYQIPANKRVPPGQSLKMCLYIFKRKYSWLLSNSVHNGNQW